MHVAELQGPIKPGDNIREYDVAVGILRNIVFDPLVYLELLHFGRDCREHAFGLRDGNDVSAPPWAKKIGQVIAGQ